MTSILGDNQDNHLLLINFKMQGTMLMDKFRRFFNGKDKLVQNITDNVLYYGILIAIKTDRITS